MVAQDASTLDFDLALDEDMFQQETPLSQSADNDRIALLARGYNIHGRQKKSIRQEHVSVFITKLFFPATCAYMNTSNRQSISGSIPRWMNRERQGEEHQRDN